MTVRDDIEDEEKGRIDAEDDLEQKEESEHSVRPGLTSGRQFPSPFYDAVNGKLLEHPVVNLSGDSIEKDTATDGIKYYPNRALEAIIKREMSLRDNGPIGSVHRMREQLQEGWNNLLSKSAFGHEHRPLPESYYCPIACELMLDPVVTPSGQSYEREAIRQWIVANGTSPTTRQPLTLKDLRPNNALYNLIQAEKNYGEDSMHPSFRRWRESGVADERPDAAVVAAADAEAEVTVPPPQVEYPTTPQELEERRREQSRQNLTCCLLVVTMIVVVTSVPYGGIFFFLCLVLFLLRACCQAAAS